MYIPGFTDALAKEIETPQVLKKKWICQLKMNDIVDVLCLNKSITDKPRWCGAIVERVEFEKIQNIVKCHKIHIKYRTIGVRDVLDLLNLLNTENQSKHNHIYNYDYETMKRIDKATEHERESVYCQHWRHDLLSRRGVDVDFFVKQSNPRRWVIGNIGEYIKGAGIKVTYFLTDPNINNNQPKLYFEYIDPFDEAIAPLGIHAIPRVDIDSATSNIPTTTKSHTDSSTSGWLGLANVPSASDTKEWAKSLAINTVSTVSFGYFNFSKDNQDYADNSNQPNNQQMKAEQTKTSNYSYTSQISMTKIKKKTTFLQAWLRVIDRVHLQKNSTPFKPCEIFKLLCDYDSRFSDGGQHDAIEALTVILQEIKASLPDSLKRNTDSGAVDARELCVFPIHGSIYDKEFEWNINTDREVCIELIKSNQLSFGGDIVSEYFQGIESICETCLNCGKQRRLYRTFSELSLPVISSKDYVFVNLYYYNYINKNYEKVNVKAPKGCNIGMIKFLALNKIFHKAKLLNDLNRFDLIQVDSTCKNNINCARILYRHEWIARCFRSNCVLLLVPRIRIGNNSDNDAGKPQSIYTQWNYVDNHLLFCVLSFPDIHLTSNHQWFKKQLQHSERFLNHFQSQTKNNSFNSSYNHRVRSSKENDNLYCIENFISRDFSTYCNGRVCQQDSDTYLLHHGVANNMIFGYYASNINSLKTINNNKNGSQKVKLISDHFSIRSKTSDDSKVGDMKPLTNDLEKCASVSSIMTRIKSLPSIAAAILDVSDAITKLKKPRETWYSSFEIEMETRVSPEFEQINLEAYELVLAKLQKLASNRRDIISSIQQTIDRFWNENPISNGKNIDCIDKSQANKDLNSLKQCLAEYQSVKFMNRVI